MLRTFLNSKIHQARVTDANIEYEGSLTLDIELIEQAGFGVYEKILVVDIENGNRFETYLIEGERHSRTVCVNGAAAHLVQKGDRLIIMSFTQLASEEIKKHKPTVIRLNAKNEPL